MKLLEKFLFRGVLVKRRARVLSSFLPGRLQNYIRKGQVAVVAHALNPSIWEAETGSLETSLVGLYRDPVSRKESIEMRLKIEPILVPARAK